MDHTYASAIVEAQKTHARKPADFYPTPPDVTAALLAYLDLPLSASIWEPACGDGAMSKVLVSSGFQTTSTDLRENTGYGEGGVDFLTAEPEELFDWVITNPPFKLAEQFINRALAVAPNAAMLLKSQFWHAKSREPLFRKHPPTWILPLTWRPSFLEAERGNSPLMDVIWCVWLRGQNGTKVDLLIRPEKGSKDKHLQKLLG